MIIDISLFQHHAHQITTVDPMLTFATGFLRMVGAMLQQLKVIASNLLPLTLGMEVLWLLMMMLLKTG